MQNENLQIRVEELKTQASKCLDVLKSIKEDVLCVEKACRILLALFIALGLIFIIAMIYSAVRFIKP
jgi:hypothetical protein